MRGCGITPFFFVWTNSTFMWIYSTILQTFRLLIWLIYSDLTDASCCWHIF